MPEPGKFLKAFGLIKGSIISNYRLDNVKATHEAVIRYKEYIYLITLEFTKLAGGNYEKFISKLNNLLKEEYIVYGIRNPYVCKIDFSYEKNKIILDHYGNVTIKLIGHANRS